MVSNPRHAASNVATSAYVAPLNAAATPHSGRSLRLPVDDRAKTPGPSTTPTSKTYQIWVPENGSRAVRNPLPPVHPFGFVKKKKPRALSEMSLEAVDGSGLMSSTASTLSMVSSVEQPPWRDPAVATRRWRKLENQNRGRMPKPGVTFDVGEDPLHPKSSKIYRQQQMSRSRSSSPAAS